MTELLKPYKQVILQLARYYGAGEQLSREALEFQSTVLSKFPLEEVDRAAVLYCQDFRNKFMPRPIAAIMAYTRPHLDEEEEAIAIAARIWDAIGKFGYPDPRGAEAYVGPGAWAVVRASGGWAPLCHNSRDAEGGVFKAQLRQLAKATMKRVRAGQADKPIALPAATVQGLVDQTAKKLEMHGAPEGVTGVPEN